MAHGEFHGLERRQGGKHLRCRRDLGGAQYKKNHEPDERDGPEQATDALRPETLDREQPDDDAERNGNDQRLEGRCHHVQPFDGAQHGDGRGEKTIAKEQGGPGHAEHHVEKTLTVGQLAAASHQRHQGKDTALPAIVGPHHDENVLERDHDDQRPGDQGEDTENIVRCRTESGEVAETLLDGVKGTGADIAVDNAERCEGKRRHPPAFW